jgi:hypothetical protein
VWFTTEFPQNKHNTNNHSSKFDELLGNMGYIPTTITANMKQAEKNTLSKMVAKSRLQLWKEYLNLFIEANMAAHTAVEFCFSSPSSCKEGQVDLGSSDVPGVAGKSLGSQKRKGTHLDHLDCLDSEEETRSWERSVNKLQWNNI